MKEKKTALSSEKLASEWHEIIAAQSDPRKFGVLYNRYFDVIYRFIHRRTNDLHLSSELTSNVFLKAIENLNKYENKGFPFSSWLYRVASNEVSSYYRGKAKNEKRVVSLEKIQIHSIVDDMKLDLNQNHNIEKLQNALPLLSQIDLQIVELRFFEQRSYKEIGEILKITENNAKVKTYRALNKLHKILS